YLRQRSATLPPLELGPILNIRSFYERSFAIVLTTLSLRDIRLVERSCLSSRAVRVSGVPNSPSTNHSNGRPRRRYLARRLEILRAAGNQFRLRGFAETGMRDIAAAADLSPANLYNYFRGKHEILYFCQDVSLDRMIAALERARRLRATAGEKLRLVI